MSAFDLKSRILSAAQQTPSRTRTSQRRLAVLGYLAAAVGTLVVFQYKGGLAHGEGRPMELTLALVAGAVAIAAGAMALGTWRGRSSVGRPSLILAATPLLVPLLTYVWMSTFSGRYVEPFYRFGWVCMTMTIVSGTMVMAVGMALRRRSVATHAALQGASIAAGAGAVAGVIVDAWCPLTNAPHVLIGHVMPMVVLGVAGALLGPVALSIKR